MNSQPYTIILRYINFRTCVPLRLSKPKQTKTQLYKDLLQKLDKLVAYNDLKVMDIIRPFLGRFAQPFNLIVSGPSQSGLILQSELYNFTIFCIL